MAKALKQLDLANRRYWETILFGLHSNPLERHELIILHVPRLVHLAVRSLTNLNQTFVQPLSFWALRRERQTSEPRVPLRE